VVLAYLKSGLILVAAITMASLGGGQDPAGRAYLHGGFVIGGLYWVVFILPALLLLRRSTGRRVGLGFALLILPDVFSLSPQRRSSDPLRRSRTSGVDPRRSRQDLARWSTVECCFRPAPIPLKNSVRSR
jgi:hypothetical protein